MCDRIFFKKHHFHGHMNKHAENERGMCVCAAIILMASPAKVQYSWNKTDVERPTNPRPP